MSNHQIQVKLNQQQMELLDCVAGAAHAVSEHEHPQVTFR